MPTASYPKRTEQNVIDLDGTLIFSHGRLAGGSAKTKAFAEKHKRPYLHVNLQKISAFEAAINTLTWIQENGIEILNVAGSRASKDPGIYRVTKGVLMAVLSFDLILNNK